MFTVTTVDGWQELVVMPMICPDDGCPEGFMGSPTVPEDLLVVFFFVSFIVIVVWTMLPVVVAILLENFTNATRVEELASERKKMARSGLDKMQHTLDPIFEVLSHYNTDLDLSQKIYNLFQVMVADDDQSRVNFKVMSSGLRRKKWLQRIHMSQEDFDSFTCHGFYTTDGWLTAIQFEQAMRTQLKRYVQRQVAKQQFLCATCPGQETSSSMLLALKLLHMDVHEKIPQGLDPEEDLGGAMHSMTVCPKPVSVDDTNKDMMPVLMNGEPQERRQMSSSHVLPSVETNFGGADAGGQVTRLWQERMEGGQEKVEVLVRNLCDSVNSMRAEISAVTHDLADIKLKVANISSQRPAKGDFELYSSHIAFPSARQHNKSVSLSETPPQNGNVSASVVFPKDPSGSTKANSYRKSLLAIQMSASVGDDQPY